MQFLLYASVWQRGGSVISVDEQFNCTVLWQAAEEHQDSGWDVHPSPPPITVPFNHLSVQEWASTVKQNPPGTAS